MKGLTFLMSPAKAESDDPLKQDTTMSPRDRFLSGSSMRRLSVISILRTLDCAALRSWAAA